MKYLLLLLLAGCASVPTTEYDSGPAMEVRIVWHRTEKTWQPFIKTFGGKINRAMLIEGYFVFHEGVCHVYAPDNPIGGLAILGHEVKHCFDGKFHD